MDLKAIDTLLAGCGLTLLGAFHPTHDDGVPGLENSAPETTSLVLVGNAGPAMWRAFNKHRRRESDPDPLDDWSRETIRTRAATLSKEFNLPVTALFPFDGPPYLPFQKWAQRTGNVHRSPLGPVVHHQYGLWHAYRGALLIPAKLALPPLTVMSSPCDTCADKPCLAACPVHAFDGTAYNVPACVEHLASGAGEDCFRLGCLARAACPVGTRYAYDEDQARFHLGKFFAAHR